MTVSRMTSKERIVAALRREDVDHVPCAPWLNPLHERQRVGFTWQFPWGPSFREKAEYLVNVLGVDAFGHVGVPRFNPAPGVSCRVWMERDVIHKVWTTPAGELSAAVRYDEKWIHGLDIPFYSDFLIGHSVKHWVETERDVECLKHILRPPEDAAALERMRFDAMEVKAVADRMGLPLIAANGLGLTGAMHLMGSSEICIKAIEEPQLINSYLELEHQVNLKCLEMTADLGVDIVIRNGFYETGDFYSPAMLTQFLLDRLNAEVRACKALGMAASYTLNTGVMPIRDYLAKLEFDGFNYVDIAFHDFDLASFRDSQPATRAYWIGPSSSYHIWKDDPELTRAAVRQCFEAIGKRGLLITACPSTHSIMPWQNTLAMIDEWKKLR